MEANTKRLHSDLETAMREKNELRVGVLRMLLAALHKRGIEKRTSSGSDILTDEECVAVLRSEAKKRRESRDIFVSAKRDDLAQKEEAELAIISDYLPAEVPREKIELAAKKAIEKTGAVSIKQMGVVMKEVMQELGGQADGSLVSAVIKEMLPS